MKGNKILLLTPIALAVLVGCNGSSSSTENNSSLDSPVEKGVFIDEAVKGIYYKTATQSGCTDSEGTFYYKDGESVVFSIGKCDESNKPIENNDSEIIIGKTEGLGTVTPYNLAVAEGESQGDDAPAINIARLLKTINTDTGSDKLDISGIVFTGNGVDKTLKNDIKELVSKEDAADRVLKQETLNKIKQANKNHSKPISKDSFISSEEAREQLSDTINKLPATIKFTASELENKYLIVSHDTVLRYNEDSGKNATEGFDAHGNGYILFNNDNGDASSLTYNWGLLPSGMQNITFKEDGETIDIKLSILSKSRSKWSVRATTNDNGKEYTEIEQWRNPARIDAITSLMGTYQSNNHTFSFALDGTQLSFKDVDNSSSEFVEFSSPYTITKEGYVTAHYNEIDLTILAENADASKIVVIATGSEQNATKAELVEFAKKK